MWVAAGHPDQFVYVAVWGAPAGFSPQDAAEFEKRNAAFLEQADRVNKLVKLFSISAGDKDVLLAGARNLSELLNQRGIKNQLHVSGGGHT